ncbi:PspA/IM30 family protein [Halomonas sp. YLB-10]|uniref:PspA/IM30 family protein n=1 Tax=Halomonas sp. RT37 TaxID=2950872 RepID=A0AAU7KKS1_9GAMM|nr:PspA/IM30 family protein [Halomonas sp. YLB-10]RQW69516.1 PspA/IM30 family protein [Halomonas sp. YLB-10]|tara:strand:- start:2602 stop:3327 length:726 start_codon:yes stop_codon:yes gene_type:complete
MSLWTKLHTLVRATAHEPVEKLVDANALRIMAQEIREAEQALHQARLDLAGLIAERRQLERHNQQLAEQLEAREHQARAALEQDDEALALAVASRIAEVESQLTSQRQHAEALSRQEQTLREELGQAAQSLRHYQREMKLAKARSGNAGLGRKLGACSTGLQRHMDEIATSYERIRTSQQHQAEVTTALKELDEEASGQDLDRRLRTSGILEGSMDARSVLARLKAQGSAAAVPGESPSGA